MHLNCLPKRRTRRLTGFPGVSYFFFVMMNFESTVEEFFYLYCKTAASHSSGLGVEYGSDKRLLGATCEGENRSWLFKNEQSLLGEVLFWMLVLWNRKTRGDTMMGRTDKRPNKVKWWKAAEPPYSVIVLNYAECQYRLRRGRKPLCWLNNTIESVRVKRATTKAENCVQSSVAVRFFVKLYASRRKMGYFKS